MGNHSLVLQQLTTLNTGSYSCQATNTVGRAMSNLVDLDIKCKYLFVYLFVKSKPWTNTFILLFSLIPWSSVQESFSA